MLFPALELVLDEPELDCWLEMLLSNWLRFKLFAWFWPDSDCWPDKLPSAWARLGLSPWMEMVVLVVVIVPLFAAPWAPGMFWSNWFKLMLFPVVVEDDWD